MEVRRDDTAVLIAKRVDLTMQRCDGLVTFADEFERHHEQHMPGPAEMQKINDLLMHVATHDDIRPDRAVTRIGRVKQINRNAHAAPRRRPAVIVTGVDIAMT
jgi:hypothetical protein